MQLSPEHLAPVYIWFFVVGTIFGSFGNVLIARLPKNTTIGGRSHCPHCKHTLSVWDLIPLLSYAYLQAKCRYCKKPISAQYPLIEFLSGVLFLAALSLVGAASVPALCLALALWLMLVIAIIDARTQLIADALNLPLLVLAIVYSLSSGSLDMYSLIIGVGFLGLQWIISRGAWVGSGDIFLIASMAFLVGRWEAMALCILLAYVFGGAFSAVLLAQGTKKRGDSIAFAPFLTLATYATLFYGDLILHTLYGV